MTQYFQDWDGGGGTSGTAITATNTAGTDQFAITSTAANTGATATFSNAQKHSGALSVLMSYAASTALYMTFTAGAAVGQRAVYRAYVYLPDLTATRGLFTSRSASAAVGGLVVNTAGELIVVNIDGTQTFTSSTTQTVPTGAWFRVELGLTIGSTTTSGAWDLSVFTSNSGDNATADWTASGTGFNFGTVASTIARFGYSGQLAANTWYIDDIGIDTALNSGVIGSSATAPYTDSFTGADNAAWSSKWVTSAGATQITTNQGASLTGASAYGQARADLTGLAKTTDTDVVVSGIFDAAAEEFIAVGINSDAVANGGYNSTNSYSVLLLRNYGQVQLVERANGTQTTLLTTSGYTFAASTKYKVHFVRTGTTLQFRVWDATLTEPTTWDGSYVDTAILPAGWVSLGAMNGADAVARTILFDDLTVTIPTAALPYTETFTDVDGAPWSQQWSVPTDATGTATIQANAGALTSPSGATYANGGRLLTGMTPIGDTDITTTFVATSVGVEQYVGVTINSVGALTAANSIMLLLGYEGGTSSYLALFQGNTQIGPSVPMSSLAGGVTYGIRLRRSAGNVYARLWDASTTEPTTWQFQQPQSSFTAGFVDGVVGLLMQNGGDGVARTGTFDNLTVSVPVAYTGTAALAATGTLSTGSIAPTVAAAPALSGSGTLGVAATPGVPAAGTLSGAGALTVTGQPAVAVTVTLSGSGSLGDTGSAATGSTGALSGSGALTTSPSPATAATVSLSGSGSLGAAGSASPTSSSALTGSGSLSAAAATTSGSSAPALSGSGTLSTGAQSGLQAPATLTGTGTMSAGGNAGLLAALTLAGLGQLTVGSTRGGSVPVTLSGVGTLLAIGLATYSGGGPLGAGLATIAFDTGPTASVSLDRVSVETTISPLLRRVTVGT